MNHKCLDNELFDDIDHCYDHHRYDDAAFLSFDEPANQADLSELGQWILQAQDGNIEQADFDKLQHWLLRDPCALTYYVEFSWLCAALHTLYHEKQVVLA